MCRLYICPHATIYVSSHYYMYVYICPKKIMQKKMPPHTTIYLCAHTVCPRYRSPLICVLRLLYMCRLIHMCPHTTMHNASSYQNIQDICVLILPYIMPPHTRTYMCPQTVCSRYRSPLGHRDSRYYLYVSSDNYISASLPYSTMCHMLHRCAPAVDRLVDTQPRRLVDYGALKKKRR